jgi:hypothetical protein
MITFIAPAHYEKYDPYMFVASMLCQKNANWKAIIYHNGPNSLLESIITGFNDPRLLFRQSENNTGAWGTYNRIDALNNIVDTEYVVQTSIQDYWLPNAVKSILEHQDMDFIYWNSINHLAGYENVLDCQPVVDRIDWGNFAIRTNIARQVGIKNPTEFTADGLFVTDCMNSGLIASQLKLDKILTIHN